MGFVSGDRINWQRWWAPVGDDVPLWEGMLTEPVGSVFRPTSPSLAPLSDSAGRRVRVLLADGGMGKSTELVREVERLRGSGVHVETVDLGACVTGGDVREAVEDCQRGWAASGARDLVIALDGFDEHVLDIGNLSEVLTRGLSRFDPDRLQVIIASRTSLWRRSLQDSLAGMWGEGETVALQLAPLSASNIREAAASEELEGVSFLSHVRAVGAGPLAARPITLRLLLTAARQGDLPSRQLDVFETGVAGLVEETGDRRVAERRTGTPRGRRVIAARRLAAVSLLSGRPSIVRRASSTQASNQLALEDVADEGVLLEELEDVWDSALLVGGLEARTWCHHSVVEYLCAAQVAGMPVDSVTSLLAAPADPGCLLPQLEQTAAWVAAMNSSMFDHLLEHRPDLLLNPDLRGRSDDERRKVAQAYLAALVEGHVLADRSVYDALAGPGIGDDLRPLLAADQPLRVRHEALWLVEVTDTRALDDVLLDVVKAGTAPPPAGYTEEVELAGRAVRALAGCADPAVVQRLHAVLADPNAHPTLRAAVVAPLFPARLSVAQLQTFVEPGGRSIAAFARPVIQRLREAVNTEQIPVGDLLEWFSGQDIGGYDPAARELASAAVLDVLRREPVESSRWNAAAGTVAQLLDGASSLREWSQEDVDALGDHRRRRLALAVARGQPGAVAVGALIRARLVGSGDLSWWLIRLETEPDDEVATQSVRSLAWAILEDDGLLEAARRQCRNSESLRLIGEEEFEATVVEERRALLAEQRRREAARLAEHAEEQFSAERLGRALSLGDAGAVLNELRRGLPREQYPHAGVGRLQTWRALDDVQRAAVVSVLIGVLTSGHLDVADDRVACDLQDSLEIITAMDANRLDDVPGDLWLGWLPALFGRSDRDVTSAGIRRAHGADHDATLKILMEQVQRDVGGHVWLSDVLPYSLPSDTLQALAESALVYAADPLIHPESLSGLLRIGECGSPARAAGIALAHVRRCPAAPTGPIRKLNDPAADWRRAVVSAQTLATGPGFADAFDELLTAFTRTRSLGLEAVRGVRSWDGSAWTPLEAEQLARFYLWARQAIPIRRYVPGVVVNADPVDELPGDVLRALISKGDERAKACLDGLVVTTGNEWIKSEAARLRASLIATSTPRPSPSALREALTDSDTRIVTTRGQLAQVVLAAIDDLARDLSRDRRLRHRLWERQRDGTDWNGAYVPIEENNLSDEIHAELRLRLQTRVASFREVQIQARLSATPGDRPDLLAVCLTTDQATITMPIEVKCNWHPQVLTALQTQLADRYLNGPEGDEGIYVVGYFHGDRWASTDRKRLTAARGRTRDELIEELQRAAERAAQVGKTVHVRVIDIPLDLDEASSPSPEPIPPRNAVRRRPAVG